MIKTPLIERIERCYGSYPDVQEIVLHPDDRAEYNKLCNNGEALPPARFLCASPIYNHARENEEPQIKEVPGEKVVDSARSIL